MNRLKGRQRASPTWTFLAPVLAISILALLSIILQSTWFNGQSLQNNMLQRRSYELFEEEEKECRLVHQAKDKCAFVLANCPDEEAGLFSYLTLYYCRLPHVKPIAFIIIVLWAGLLFTTIGVAASDFFSPNLGTIAHVLGMSDSVAGVTFLAFGNGSTDLFSTFAAMKSHSGSLAVGELIGAASFISAVVPGTMALIRPFRAAKTSFIRDVSLLAVAISFSMVFLANGKLEMWECLVMVIFYCCYALGVVVWHWWLEKRRRHRERIHLSRNHYVLSEATGQPEEYHDEDNPPIAQGVTTEDLSALEQANEDDDEVSDDLVEEEERERWMSELSSNMRVTRVADGERTSAITPIRPSLIGALEFQAVLNSLQKSRNNRSLPINLRRYSDDPTFTTVQQQDALSTLSDPEGLSTVERSIDDYLNPEASGSTIIDNRLAGTRARAVSANDAASLQIDPAMSRRAFAETRTSSTSTFLRPGNVQRLSSVRNSRSIVRPPSPILSVSPPASEEQSREVSPEARSTHAKSTSQDLLAPPGMENTPRLAISTEPATTATDTRPVLPKLKISPPGSIHSRNPSPIRSPFKSFLDNPSPSRTSRSPSIYLTRTDSPEALASVVSDAEGSTKPLRYWPYSILPPPGMLMRTLFPTIYMWSEKNLWQKALGIASAPSIFFLTITLPVVQREEEESAELARTNPGTPLRHNSNPPKWMHSKSSSIQSDSRHLSIGTDANYGSSATTAVSIEEHNTANPDPKSTVQTPLLQPQHPHQIESIAATKDWNRWLVIVQCFTAPWFLVLIFWANLFYPDVGTLVKWTLYSLLASLILLLLLLFTTSPIHPPRWRFLLSFVGFAVAIAWISSIANEVVGVLKTIGVVFNISDAILGLTIFAVGNSLGDLVADITVARLGHPVMALSACFGGPMLNILLGIGLSGLYVTINGAEKKQKHHPGRPLKFKPYHMDISMTLLISAVTLLITLVGLLIVVPLNNWRMDKRIGIGLITLWTLSTIGNLVVELTGLGDKLSRA